MKMERNQRTGGIENKMGTDTRRIPRIDENAYAQIRAYQETAETAGGPTYLGRDRNQEFYN